MRHYSLDRTPTRGPWLVLVGAAISYVAVYVLLRSYPPVPDEGYLPWYFLTLRLFPIVATVYSLALLWVLRSAHLRAVRRSSRSTWTYLTDVGVRGAATVVLLVVAAILIEIVGIASSLFEVTVIAATVFLVLLFPLGLMWHKLAS